MSTAVIIFGFCFCLLAYFSSEQFGKQMRKKQLKAKNRQIWIEKTLENYCLCLPIKNDVFCFAFGLFSSSGPYSIYLSHSSHEIFAYIVKIVAVTTTKRKQTSFQVFLAQRHRLFKTKRLPLGKGAVGEGIISLYVCIHKLCILLTHAHNCEYNASTTLTVWSILCIIRWYAFYFYLHSIQLALVNGWHIKNSTPFCANNS